MISKLTSFTLVLLVCASAIAQSTAGGPQPATIVLTLADALERARANSPQFQAAVTELGLAREDRYQARAALLPGVDYNNAFTYTQGNGTSTGRYIGANGVHEYVSQGVAHEVIGAAQVLDYQRAAAVHALAKARAEIATRGLTVTVVQSYFGLLATQTRTINAERAFNEGQHFLELSRKLGEGGEVAHSDTIKAQIQANDLKRAWQEAKLTEQNARLALAVLLFPNFFQDFTLANDLATMPALPPMNELQTMAAKNNPELQAAFAALAVANKQVGVAKAGYLPSLSVDMFYGIDANQFAKRAPDGTQNLGYQGIATLNIPVWNWGATQSKVRQAELLRHQAQVELSAAQRQALADLQSFYSEAQLAYDQLQMLKQTTELAEQSLRLTTLRYQGGEATALEVVDAQNTLTAAGNSYHDGEARYHVALANLQTLTGAF
ncbi:MAG TPA: TolC family protein [Candidatus Methylomirabilis sp.]|nr:TolC family protein [Candidatus Methylomirabilis sp.]